MSILFEESHPVGQHVEPNYEPVSYGLSIRGNLLPLLQVTWRGNSLRLVGLVENSRSLAFAEHARSAA